MIAGAGDAVRELKSTLSEGGFETDINRLVHLIDEGEYQSALEVLKLLAVKLEANPTGKAVKGRNVMAVSDVRFNPAVRT